MLLFHTRHRTDEHPANNNTDMGGKANNLIEIHKQVQIMPEGFFAIPDFAILTKEPRDGTEYNKIQKSITENMANQYYAVRSSATGEDGLDHSMAGQFDSILHVTPENLPKAIAQVFASVKTDSVQDYCREHGINPTSVRMNVIIQTMIQPHMAGIAFAQDPIYGARGYAIVSSTPGLGDSLAAGTINGSQWYVRGKDILLVEHPDDASANAYNNNDIHQKIVHIAQLARTTSNIFGSPQDIEWAYADNQLYLLQSRPITTGHDNSNPLPDILTWAMHSDYLATTQKKALLDNSNIVESYPGIVSPLTFSFAQRAYAATYKHFMRLMGVPQSHIDAQTHVFDTMLEHVDGRVYYRLEHWYHALSMLPGYQINAKFMGTMMGLKNDVPAGFAPPAPQKGYWNKIKSIGRTIQSVGAIIHAARKLPTTYTNFMTRVNTANENTRNIPHNAPLNNLLNYYIRIDHDLLLAWDAPLVNDFLCMMAFGLTKKWLHQCAGDEGDALHNAFLINQGDVISTSPAALIQRMSDIARTDPATMEALTHLNHAYLLHHSPIASLYSEYIDRFGHRCTEELKLESLSLHIDPTPLIHAITAATKRNTTNTTDHTTTPDITLDDIIRITKLSNIKARILYKALIYTRNRVRDRENLRYARTIAFGIARDILRHIGDQFIQLGIIDNVQDIFYLSIEDVVNSAYITGNIPIDTLKNKVATAKQHQQQQTQLPTPPERWIYRHHAAEIIPHQRPIPKDATTYTGTPCSAGNVEGRAYVVEDPRNAQLSPGDILVAHHTDPGWISLFANAAGVVVEKGSPLSHSAIVSREMNIPCVVAIPGVCQWIPHGAPIRVNGTTGEVTILPTPST